MDGYPQTGTGNDVGDFLVLLFLVFFGTSPCKTGLATVQP